MGTRASYNDKSAVWRWINVTILLPMLVAFGVFGLLTWLELDNSFAQNFGSGELFSITSMMMLVLAQEIELVPKHKRSSFIAAMESLSLLIIVGGWIAFGALRCAYYLYFPTRADKGLHMLNQVATASSLILVGIAVLCIATRVNIKK